MAAAAGVEELHESVSESVSKEVFSRYVCRSIDRGMEHPGDISEAASLSAIALPASEYPIWDSIPASVVEEGKLSKLQLEGIRYACTKHLRWLPSGERAGFFIGDGAGVGKGRQISGILMDNFARGRRRHIWVSTSNDLHNDAIRDLRDLGCHMPIINNCQELDRETRALGLPKDLQEGVLFVTYSTMIGITKGKTRLQQIIDWLCAGDSESDFDGCILFDECHKAKNFMAGKEGQATKVSVAVIELQKRLPSARVVYCSATGVSEVGHMAYMNRMGLWGPGSAFKDFDTFLSSLKQRGVTFMELLAMEMKAEGKYVARGLSFKDAEFCEVSCALSPEQIEMYNGAVQLMRDLRTGLSEALIATGSPPSVVWRTYWGVFQRFFKLLCISAKVPTIVEQAKAALAEGHCVVIGMQTTGEAAAEALNLEPGCACGWVSTTRVMVQRFIHDYFPTRYTQPSAGGEAAAGYPPGGEAPEDPACVVNKAFLLDKLDNLDLPPNFLDQIVHELGGPSEVAEMTGRRARIVASRNGVPVFQLRASAVDASAVDSLNIQEKDAFNAGKKLVAVISDAASTGISLHACPRFKNQRRRVHITIELPWSADKAIQQLGRTHRSNQVSGPLYKLVITNLGGEQRFAAAVARRLQSLGALTRGDRRAASGIDLSASNLDSPLGRRALRRMYDNLVTESEHLPPGVQLSSILGDTEAEACLKRASQFSESASAALGIAVQNLHCELREAAEIMGVGIEGSAARPDTIAETKVTGISAGNGQLGDVRRFLNRLLGMPVDRQNLLYSYLAATLAAETRAAIQEGRYSEGFSDLPCSSYSLDRTHTFWTDSHSGLTTIQHDFTLDRGISFKDAVAKLERERSQPGDHSGFYEMRRPMYGTHPVMLALQRPGQSGMFSTVRPNTGVSYIDMPADELHEKYRPCQSDEEKVSEQWGALYSSTLTLCMHGKNCVNGSSCQVGRRKSEVTILSGTVVRIWGALEQVLERSAGILSRGERAMRVVRLQLEGGANLVGVRYPRVLLPEVAAVLRSAKDLEAVATVGLSGASMTGAHRRSDDQPTPINHKMLARSLRPPRTIFNFFSSATSGAEPRAAVLKDSVAKENQCNAVSECGFVKRPAQKEVQMGMAVAVGKKRRKGDSEKSDSAALKKLQAMGFSGAQATKALREASGNLDRAVNWLLAFQ